MEVIDENSKEDAESVLQRGSQTIQRSETGFSFGTQKSFNDGVNNPKDSINNKSCVEIDGLVKSDSQLTSVSKLKDSQSIKSS